MPILGSESERRKKNDVLDHTQKGVESRKDTIYRKGNNIIEEKK